MALFASTNQFEQLSARLKEGRRKLHRELDYCPRLLQTLASLPATGRNLREVLITSGEINDRHGTGLLLSRLFPGDSAFNIHARSFYGTQGAFAAVEIANRGPGDQFASFMLREIAGFCESSTSSSSPTCRTTPTPPSRYGKPPGRRWSPG